HHYNLLLVCSLFAISICSQFEGDVSHWAVEGLLLGGKLILLLFLVGRFKRAEVGEREVLISPVVGRLQRKKKVDIKGVMVEFVHWRVFKRKRLHIVGTAGGMTSIDGFSNLQLDLLETHLLANFDLLKADGSLANREERQEFEKNKKDLDRSVQKSRRLFLVLLVVFSGILLYGSFPSDQAAAVQWGKFGFVVLLGTISLLELWRAGLVKSKESFPIPEADNLPQQFDELIKTLIVMSLPLEKQREFYGLGVIADEMMLDFESHYTLNKDRFAQTEWINEAAKKQLDEIDALTEAWSAEKEEDFWFDMEKHPSDWDVLRQKASRALTLLEKDHLTVDIKRENRLDENGNIMVEHTIINLIEK
ncbi:MAG: hypothetical protein AAFV25_26415, partial [Bacteroidota bacterium]